MSQVSVGTSHSRKFERVISGDNETQALGPVIFAVNQLTNWTEKGRPNLETTKFLVRGSVWVPMEQTGKKVHRNADARLMSISCAPVAQFIAHALKTGHVEPIKVISRSYGNVSGAGVQDALLLQVTGSKEADALAEQYGFAITKTVKTGRNNEYEETLTNPIAVTLTAALIATDSPLATAPMAKEQSFSRLDGDNPDILDALAYCAKNGQLPERVQTARQVKIDDEFASEVNVAPREPRGQNRTQQPQAQGRQRRAAASDDYI